MANGLQVLEGLPQTESDEEDQIGRGLIWHANLTAEAELLVRHISSSSRGGPQPYVRVLGRALRTATATYRSTVREAVHQFVDGTLRSRRGPGVGVRAPETSEMSLGEAAWRLVCIGSSPQEVGTFRNLLLIV
jgi:hypothetical protein